ncbi:MAG: CheR family methyltransferase [Acidobacteriota bacterium]
MGAESRAHEAGIARELGPFKELLLRACGFGFENERESALIAGLCRRMASTKAKSAGAYLALVSGNPDETRRLVELLTVNETYFLREQDHLRLVTGRIIPELLAQRPGGAVRLLSAGCSTGEEPFSLAILLREELGPEFARFCHIAGVDIDGSVLDAARQGVYGKGSFRAMDAGLVRRHFSPSADGTRRLADELRSAVRFEAVSLLAPEYPPVMQNQDVIFYRNVSIYFPANVQKDVFRRLAGCLNDGGYLLLGAAETLPHDIGLLTLVERDGLFLYRKVPGVSPKARSRPGGPRPASAPLPSKAPAPAKPYAVKAPPRLAPGKRQPGPQAAADADTLFEEALALARRQMADASLAALDRLLADGVNCLKAHVLKGSILMSLDRIEEARAECRLALAIDPLCQEATLMLGMAALHKGDGQQALRYFRETIYLHPACWLAHFHLAEIMYSLGEWKRAKGAYEASQRLLEGPADTLPPGYFPLSFNAAQFTAVCRHKLALLRQAG